MKWKNLGLKILYPHIAIIVCFLPLTVATLVYSLVFFNPTSIISIISYVFAFYMLVVICLRMPKIINFFKNIKRENQFIKRWFSDAHLRINVSLYGSLIWNGLFAIFQLGLGFYHNALWFYAMAAYYIMLAIMRFFLVNHTRKYKANEKTQIENKKYLLCGWLLLFMNLALALIIALNIYQNNTFNHNTITAITLAIYTFTTFTFAIVNIIKYKKYNSLVYSAAKNITLIAACVSMLTLETVLLNTFGDAESESFRQIILSLSGLGVLGFAIIMAIIMIIKATKYFRQLSQK